MVKSFTLTATNSHGFQTLSSSKIPFPMRQPFIINGYRLLRQPWYYYVNSLFKWHNETLNVWSHIIAASLIFVQVYKYGQKDDLLNTSDGQKILTFAIGCVSMTILSSVAHLLGSKTTKSHIVFFLIDYAGITLYGFGTSLGSLYIVGDKKVFEYIEPYYIPVSVVVASVSFTLNCFGKIWVTDGSSWQRTFFMVIPHVLFGAFISLPVVPRYWSCYHDNECSLSSLNHLTIVYVMFVLEGCVYAMHIPEKWRPGCCDNIGQSHQTFHVCVLLTVVFQLHGIKFDIDQGHSRQLSFDFSKTLIGYFSLCILNFAVIIFLLPAINRISQEFESMKHGMKRK